MAFHREKFVPFGPPSGGDGGRGGDVYIAPTAGLTSLASISTSIRGQPGGNGQGTWQRGKNAPALVVKVPLGTVVRQLPKDDPRRAKDEWEAEQESLEGLDVDERIKKMRERRWVHYPRFVDENAKRDAFKEAEHALYKRERERRMGRYRRDTSEPIDLDLDREELHPDNTDAPLGSRQKTPLGYLVASGGSGGLGNPHFVAEKNRSPKFATAGQEGERITLSLELKLLADIGLVGMPNAGKSTLLRALTGGRAKTEVAGYAFTTLNPVIGVVKVAGDGSFEGSLSSLATYDETVVEEREYTEKMERGEFAHAPTRNQGGAQDDIFHDTQPPRPGHRFDMIETFRFTVADNPGLIVGAADNRGLGHSFLRSMERALVLAYVVDFSLPTPWDELDGLAEELEQYQTGMSLRARLVIANKADLLASSDDPIAVEAAREKLRRLKQHIAERGLIPNPTDQAIIAVSAKFNQNIENVVSSMRNMVAERREEFAE